MLITQVSVSVRIARPKPCRSFRRKGCHWACHRTASFSFVWIKTVGHRPTTPRGISSLDPSTAAFFAAGHKVWDQALFKGLAEVWRQSLQGFPALKKALSQSEIHSVFSGLLFLCFLHIFLQRHHFAKVVEAIFFDSIITVFHREFLF